MRTWYPLSFQSDGTLAYPDQVDGPDGIAPALFASSDGPVTDLWILSYGWNTSVEEGNDFYDTWVGLLREALQQVQPGNYTPMFLGVFWPSKILADTSSRPTPSPPSHPSPTAPSLLGERVDFLEASRPIFDPEHRQDDAVYAQDFGGIYDFITSPDLTDEPRVSAFVATLKKYQQQDPHADQPLLQNVIDTDASALAGILTSALTPLFGTAVSTSLLDFLRVFSFWTMKGRAGTVGANGLAPFLASVWQSAASGAPPLRLHLMGHSFGAKLLTSAVSSAATLPLVGQPVVTTLILFQGAFSQFVFSRTIPDHPGLAGSYVNVVEQGLVATPVAVMYSVRDLANRRLYPLGMAPILEEPLLVTEPLIDPTHYHVSGELRGAIGANGAQGFDPRELSLVTLPWTGIDERTLSTVRCINVNRTPFISLDDPLIGIHNDYKEPALFQAAVGISLLKRANT